jgi:hypothetical protein
MSVTLPLNDMTVSEKLQLMETLWEDLSHSTGAARDGRDDGGRV